MNNRLVEHAEGLTMVTARPLVEDLLLACKVYRAMAEWGCRIVEIAEAALTREWDPAAFYRDLHQRIDNGDGQMVARVRSQPTGRLTVRFQRNGEEPFGPRSIVDGYVARMLAVQLIGRLEYL